MITDGPDSPEALRFYTYANGEVLWVAQGSEPWLTDAFQQLP